MSEKKEKKVEGYNKKSVMKMPKSVKRMLSLMGDEDRRAYQPIMCDAVRSYTYHHQQMLRRKSGDKDDAGE